ncbi:MAG: flagellar basal body rod protein FlgC [Planctomycetes bacterium]|nr:flagellar basal body rod protein FlgC [Planctomycetota bacterium]
MDSMDISAAGMRAQRARMDLVAANLANVDTTSARTEFRDGRVLHVPYRRRMAVLLEGAGGLPVVKVAEDRSAFRTERQPGHPHADGGLVSFPNVDPIVEMTDMMAASRAYEANLTAIEVAKAMNHSALRILG